MDNSHDPNTPVAWHLYKDGELYCIKYAKEDRGPEYTWEPLYTHPAPTVPEIKPHQIAKLVNELRDIAVKYHDHQSLRERLAGPVHDLWRETK